MVEVDPVVLRAAAGDLGRCDEMLLRAGMSSGTYLLLAAGAVGSLDVQAAVDVLATRLTELFGALSAAHDAGEAGLLAAAAAYDDVETRARQHTELLSQAFSAAVGSYR